jgi:hypothetical protein
MMAVNVLMMGCDSGTTTQSRLAAIQEFKANGHGEWTYLALKGRGPQGHLAIESRHTDEHLAALATDPAIENSQALLGIHELNVARTSLTDAGFFHIGEMTNLVRLDASETQITGVNLHAIRRLHWLREVNLSGTQLTDRALLVLTHMPGLARLRLVDVPLTNQSLDTLAALSHVRVELSSRKMNAADRETISRQLPHVRWIHYDSD